MRLSRLFGARSYRIELSTSDPTFNPSIAAHGDGFIAIVRTLNCIVDDSGNYREIPETGLVTTNWLVEFDSSLKITKLSKLDDSNFREPCAAGGFEDARPFRWKNQWWFVASGISSHHPVATTMALCGFSGAKVTECHFLPSPLGQGVEKNWMPRVSGKNLEFVYRVSPMQVIRCNGAGKTEYENTGREIPELNGWSGSSQLVPYGSNWLCAVHLRNERPLRFTHAFTELDRDLNILRFSEPFVFDKVSIEFCAGLVLTRTHALLSYGSGDREARLLKIPLPAVDRLLYRKRKSLNFSNSIGHIATRLAGGIKVLRLTDN